MRPTAKEHVVDIFASSGVLAAKQGVLPDAIDELMVRLDLAGCNELVAELVATSWAPQDLCPQCGATIAKRTPVPHRHGRGCLLALPFVLPRMVASALQRRLKDGAR